MIKHAQKLVRYIFINYITLAGRLVLRQGGLLLIIINSPIKKVNISKK